MSDEVMEAKRAIIRELRAGFKSFAVDGKIVINRSVWMTEQGYVDSRGSLDVAATVQAVTLDDFTAALKRCLERRTTHAEKRVERLSGEMARARRIIEVLRREEPKK